MANDLLPTISRRISDRISEGGKYRVGNLCYPENVATDMDVQHYMMFYINVRESSKFNRNNRVGFVTNEGQNNIQQESTGTAATARNAAYEASAVAGGYLVAGKLADLGVGNKKLTSVVAVAGGAGMGAATITGGKGTGTENIFHIERTQRISDVITLAIQNRPSVSYGVEWAQNELGSMMGVLGGGSSASDSSTLSASMSSDIARRLAETAATVPGALNSNNRMQNLMEAGTKRVANPFREVLFKSVGFRKFEYTYRFMPKSETESKSVFDIIKTFKMHMHPELVPSGLYYIYPSDFDIVYYYKGKENRWLNKISTCALTDMRVDYGGSNAYSTFANGAPTEINLTLTFTELETLTKERILEGF